MDPNDVKKMFQQFISAQQEEAERQNARDTRHIKEIEKLTGLLQTTLPKMTPQDDPEAFLKTFERVARHYNWPEETWSPRLAPLLCGEAQLAYAGLDDSHAMSYTQVKEAILHCYRSTSDIYRQQFRSLKLHPGESPRFAALKLKDLAIQWLKPIEAEKMKLLDKIVLEQFVTILPKETQVQLQILYPGDLEAAITFAESFPSSSEDISELTSEVPMSSTSLPNDNDTLLPGKKVACNEYTTPSPSEQDVQDVSQIHFDDVLNFTTAEEVDIHSKLPFHQTGKKKLHEDSSSSANKRRRLCENDVKMMAYFDMENESRKIISQIYNKLEHLPCIGKKETDFLKELKDRVLTLKERQIHEEVVIGIVGMTGTGKNLLINALLNEMNLLPTSSTNACTSCIVQVQAHENNSSMYTAEIEFMSKEEWEEELKELLVSCKDGNNQDNNDSDHGEDSESENAKEKIIAVYGKDGLTKSFPELTNKKIHDSLKSKFISKSASQLSNEIKSYIRRNLDEENLCSYWPLVKIVKMYVPKICGLPNKLVLVDLPENGDSNKERNAMWKEYITRCSCIWIVADVKRVEYDINELKILKRKLARIACGERCQNITIIGTDEIGIPSDGSSGEATFLMGSDEHGVKNTLKVFTVSSKEYWNIKLQENELPLLKAYLREIYISQTKKAVYNYVSEVFGMISLLNVPKEYVGDKDYKNTFLYRQLTIKLKNEITALDRFFGNILETLETELRSGVYSAEKSCLYNLNSLLQPENMNFSGYRQTIKALCKNSGSFLSSTGHCIDLNYKLASPMYAAVHDTIKNTFRFNVCTKRTIKGNLNLLQSNFQEAFQSKKTAESYQLIFIKTELRRILVLLEKKILHRKIIIYNSIMQSIQEIMEPVYKDAGKEESHNSMKKIKKMFKEKLEECQSTMFKEAMINMLTEFNDLKTDVIKTLEDKMEASMMLALTHFPEGLHLPDSTNELEQMKTLCDNTNLEIFN
ncbi:nuclear GTPase SLIP-GC-like [Erpetoichthys calabaricus]|uniref:Nuclear GTPase SLIP-GC-like n=1 Tax=Erpetoichthys calabaricus TaxID=27687 RepID=A0A8C4T0Y3_ERPCA|nr:nuclear GTPase SLIP-GC-like [Erpetoichthys calabaricus]